MTAVWDVAPHPDATDREGPGSFREHEIEPFPEGMTPPAWPEVPLLIAGWIDDVAALEELTADALAFPEALALVPARFEQIHPCVDGNGRAGRLVLNLILVRLGFPPQSSTKAIVLAISRRYGEPITGTVACRRVLGSGNPRQPVQVRRFRRRWSSAPRPTPCPRDAPAFRQRPARRRHPRPRQGREGLRRHVAQLSRVGRRVRGEPHKRTS